MKLNCNVMFIIGVMDYIIKNFAVGRECQNCHRFEDLQSGCVCWEFDHFPVGLGVQM